MPPTPHAQLIDAVHYALKLWHETGSEDSPLDHLYLFQQTQRFGDYTIRQATNQVVLETLNMMEPDYGQDVDLLRLRFLDGIVMHSVANRLNMAESTANKKQRQAIRHLAQWLAERERRAREERQMSLERRLTLPPVTPLVGTEESLAELQILLADEYKWIISIEGLGGIGKTALANAFIREMALDPRFDEVAWVSAKQQEFWPDLGLRPASQAALDGEALTDALLDQLSDDDGVRGCPPAQKLAILNDLLKSRPYLIVIDNLETVADYEALLPTLLKLANPTKFILTSRSRPPHTAVTHFDLKPLSRDQTVAFLQREAERRRLSALSTASEGQLQRIYDVVGGNPLALKLVVGQVHVLPLSRVLDNLQQAQGRTIDELYTFIYWQAWQTLTPAGRQLLIAMPLAQNGTLADVRRAADLSESDLDDALSQLIDLSLLDVGSDGLEQRRYRIHRLTETFLLNEVIKWEEA